MTLRHYGLIFGCRPALCRHNIFLPKRFAGSHLNPLLAVVKTISLATGFRMPQPHTNQARPSNSGYSKIERRRTPCQIFTNFRLDTPERHLIQTRPITLSDVPTHLRPGLKESLDVDLRWAAASRDLQTQLEPDSAKTNENAPQWMRIY